MTTYTGYWLVYVNAASEEGPPQITVIPVGLVDRKRLIRDAKNVLKTADAFCSEHSEQRVVFFGEITRWLVKEKAKTWGDLGVDFEVALAHLDERAPNMVFDTDLRTATTIATPADSVVLVDRTRSRSEAVDRAPIKQRLLEVVEEELLAEGL